MDAHPYGSLPGPAVPDAPSIHRAGVPHAGLTATNEKAPEAANFRGPATETECLIFDEPGDGGKHFATLRAHLAMRGYSLSRTAGEDGPVSYFITRWQYAHELRTLADVARFLERVGGAHG